MSTRMGSYACARVFVHVAAVHSKDVVAAPVRLQLLAQHAVRMLETLDRRIIGDCVRRAHACCLWHTNLTVHQSSPRHHRTARVENFSMTPRHWWHVAATSYMRLHALRHRAHL